MTRLQLAVIGGVVLLFLVLYLGCDTKPVSQKQIEKTRALAVESTSVQVLQKEAQAEMSEDQISEIAAIDFRLQDPENDSTRIENLKLLSGKWYQFGYPAIAGYYAQEIAETEGIADSWSIAGTTYTLCIQQSKQKKVVDFCTARAINAFESAISLAPADMANRVNLALVYTENPPADNPMKGILMLKDLNEEAPENVIVLNSLGRLAIKTGQYDRAIQRLEKALNSDPENISTVCLLASAYQGSGQMEKARVFEEKCRQISSR
ncbi:MAG: hypothetical protein DHS20C18_07560 [Saprospiraceae bacterium]|nr:MAG: hypothetical protein DHS20C18_07560 [Saprospiraceae bacterium]